MADEKPVIKILKFQMIGVPVGGAMGQSQINLIIAGLGEDNKMYRWNGDTKNWELMS